LGTALKPANKGGRSVTRGRRRVSMRWAHKGPPRVPLTRTHLLSSSLARVRHRWHRHGSPATDRGGAHSWCIATYQRPPKRSRI